MFIYSGSHEIKRISPIPFLVIYIYPIVILQNYLPLFFPLSFLTTSGLYPSQKNTISLFLMVADASRKEATIEATQDKCALG